MKAFCAGHVARLGRAITLTAALTISAGLFLQNANTLGQAKPDAPATATATASAASTRPAQTPVLAKNTIEHKDVPYGGPDDKLNVLDIYSPAKAEKAPVVLFVHGGEWVKGDKREISSKPKFFNENGVVFVSMDYRLSPKANHPAQVDDVATAIAWIRANIAKYGGDGGKLVIMGHSAGCHLVTLVTLDPQYLAKVKLKPADIRGVAAWSGGMYDLVDRAKGTTGLYPPLIRQNFGESEEAQRAASPITHAKNAKSGPAFLVASVDDERSASSRQAAQALIDAINEAGGTAKSLILEGKSHFTANHELGAEGDKTGPALLEFVREVTK